MANKPAFVAAMILSLVGSAYFMSLAISSSNHHGLGWITLLPLLLIIRVLLPVYAMGCGALWGASLFAFSIYSVDSPITVTPLSLLFLTLIPATYTFVGARITRRIGFSPLLLGIGWIVVELALYPLGLHRGLLAATQGDGIVVHYIGQFTGYILVAFFVAYVNAMLLALLTRVHECLCGTRLVLGSGNRIKSFFTIELPYDLIDLIGDARPRAPPV